MVPNRLWPNALKQTQSWLTWTFTPPVWMCTWGEVRWGEVRCVSVCVWVCVCECVSVWVCVCVCECVGVRVWVCGCVVRGPDWMWTWINRVCTFGYMGIIYALEWELIHTHLCAIYLFFFLFLFLSRCLFHFLFWRSLSVFHSLSLSFSLSLSLPLGQC